MKIIKNCFQNNYGGRKRLVYQEGENAGDQNFTPVELTAEQLKQNIRTDMDTELRTLSEALLNAVNEGADVDIDTMITNTNTNIDRSLVAAERRFGTDTYDSDDVTAFHAELLATAEAAKKDVNDNAEQYKAEHAANVARALYEANLEADVTPVYADCEAIIKGADAPPVAFTNIEDDAGIQACTSTIDGYENGYNSLYSLQSNMIGADTELTGLEGLAEAANNPSINEKVKGLRTDLDAKMKAVEDALAKLAANHDTYLTQAQTGMDANIKVATDNIQNYKNDSGALQQKRNDGKENVTDAELMTAYNKFQNQPAFIEKLKAYSTQLKARKPIGGEPAAIS
jgi:hypothetical protein